MATPELATSSASDPNEFTLALKKPVVLRRIEALVPRHPRFTDLRLGADARRGAGPANILNHACSAQGLMSYMIGITSRTHTATGTGCRRVPVEDPALKDQPRVFALQVQDD